MLADRLGKMPDQIRDMAVEDFITFGAYLEMCDEANKQ
jgi:hypothetical protein